MIVAAQQRSSAAVQQCGACPRVRARACACGKCAAAAVARLVPSCLVPSCLVGLVRACVPSCVRACAGVQALARVCIGECVYADACIAMLAISPSARAYPPVARASMHTGDRRGKSKKGESRERK